MIDRDLLSHRPMAELRAMRAEKAASMETLLARAKTMQGRAMASGGTLTPKEHAALQAIIDAHDGEERDVAELDDLIANLKEPVVGQPRVTEPMSARRSPVLPPGDVGAVPAIHVPKTARFADLFKGADMNTGRQFSCFGEMALAVASGRPDQRLMNASMTEGNGASAGFLVPPQFLAGVLDGALAKEVIRPNAAVFAMSSSDLAIAGFDYQDGTSSKRAGLLLSWGAEAGVLAEQSAVARTVTLHARKATILCRVSSELAEDVVAFDRQLSAAMMAAVASGLDAAFVSGTGAGQPLGIINAPATITVTKEGSQPVNTVLIQNLNKMLARLSPASYANATWLVHPTTIPQLMTLAFQVLNVLATESVGAAGSGAVTHGSDGVLRIFGRPVVVTDACSVLSAAGDVILADLGQYAVGLRRDASIEVARETFFTTDEVAFKLRLRLDGMPLAAAPTKLRDGTNTVSPFVVLGAR